MTQLLKWLSANPSAFASLIDAVIAASVALLVFAVTQLLTQRRENVRFLTPKLEELYLLLNKVSEDNQKLFKLAYLCIQDNPAARNEIISMDELDLYGHRTAKQIIMYVRLYFPKLSRIHQHLFGEQKLLNDVLFRIHTPNPPDYSDLESACGRVAHLLRLMEQEIIHNRDRLLRDHSLPRLYRQTKDQEINAENPAPDGPVMKFPDA